MNRPLMCCVLTAMMLVVAMPVIAGEDDQPLSLEDAITKGQPIFTLRYRYEEVDQANLDSNAHDSTLRTTVGYKTGAYKGFNFMIEAEDVTVVGDPRAYSVGNPALYERWGISHLHNGVSPAERPVVADPALTQINQVFFQWKNPANKAHVGRREIIIGDARFVGNVGWRQNHQSFDAFAWTNSSLDFADLSYRFVGKVNRIFGDVQDMASHLINADVKIGKVGTLGLYGYLLDYTREWNYGQSRSTIGAEFKGKLESSDSMDLLYELEYAAQSDYADNPNSVEADYYHLMIGVATKPVTLKLGLEVLGGNPLNPDDPDYVHKGSFATPLATLHKFNGWADKFLATPAVGLSDLYFTAGGMIGPVKGLATYHLFTASEGGADLGTEFDIQFTYKTSWKQSFGLKGAFYSTDASEPIANTPHSVDTTKIWVWTGFKI
jgi:hypothetical protein